MSKQPTRRKDAPKRRPGRPSSGRERYQVKILPAVADKLRRLGGGVLSDGIERAAERIE